MIINTGECYSDFFTYEFGLDYSQYAPLNRHQVDQMAMFYWILFPELWKIVELAFL